MVLYEGKSKLRIKINVYSISALVQKQPLRRALHNRCSWNSKREKQIL